jgi:beta-glucosidase-like glycosyl hydrolase
MRVTNGIPLGSPLLLPVCTVNCVQTLKVREHWNWTGVIETDCNAMNNPFMCGSSPEEQERCSKTAAKAVQAVTATVDVECQGSFSDLPIARCAFFDKILHNTVSTELLHSRMPLVLLRLCSA